MAEVILSNIVIHKVNTTRNLRQVNPNYGIEIDVRANNGKIFLSHNLIDGTTQNESLEEFLNYCDNQFLIANIKEAGIEESVIKLLKQYDKKFFLLDCEMPYIVQNRKSLGKYLSVRYSNLESIETVRNFIDYVKWIWVDTYEDVNLKELNTPIFRKNKIVLVSPERWNKEINLKMFIEKLKDEKIKIDHVMTDEKNSRIWEDLFFKYHL
jgi:hypothetical protein